jgi:TPR repeat protein
MERSNPSSIFSTRRSEFDQAFFAFKSGDDSPDLARKFQSLASAGHLEAYLYVGCMLEDGSNGLSKDLIGALKCYESAAASGYKEGMLAVARFNLLGLAGPKNVELAFEQYLQLADKEDFSAIACYRVGRIFHSGEIVERNLENAARYYRKAALKGNLPATAFLARLEFRRGRLILWLTTYVRSIQLAQKLNKAGERSAGLRQW